MILNIYYYYLLTLSHPEALPFYTQFGIMATRTCRSNYNHIPLLYPWGVWLSVENKQTI